VANDRNIACTELLVPFLAVPGVIEALTNPAIEVAVGAPDNAIEE
jgi:hypothetical protein